MRWSPSEPERVLWQALRSSQLGAPFRRQVVMCGFIVDFFAPTARLVVEGDGVHHTRQRGADKRRDRAPQARSLTPCASPHSSSFTTSPPRLELVALALRR